MKNLRIYISLFICMLATSIAFAAPRSKEQALAIAKNKLGKAVSVSLKKTMQKAPSATRPADEPCYYVFSAQNEKGFCVVSGDDRFPEIVAYSDEGSLDMDNLPPAVEAFFKEYEATMGMGDIALFKSPSNIKVKPLLGDIKFDQGTPYNNICPTYINENGETYHCATGCVATALVQILAYWSLYKDRPAQLVKDIPGYSRSGFVADYRTGNTSTLNLPGVNKEEGQYDWGKVKYNYTVQPYTQSEADEIAKIMHHAGIALKMGYGPESGAVGVSSFFVDYYGYDPDMAVDVDRNEVGTEEFCRLLDNELLAGRPVGLDGFTAGGGGHQFVCDGSDGKGLYHINWGWGGGCDGFFDITILNPGSNDGIGASQSKDGYSLWSTILVGVQPDNGIKDEPIIVLSPKSGIFSYATPKYAITNGNMKTMFGVGNGTGKYCSFKYSVGYISGEGVVKCSDTTLSTSMSNGYWNSGTYNGSTLSFAIDKSKFENDKLYTLVAICSYDDGNTWLACDDYKNHCIFVKKINEEMAVVKTMLSLVSIEPEDVSVNSEGAVNITLQNGGWEYIDKVFLYANNVNTKPGEYSYALGPTIPAGGETSIQMTFVPEYEGLYYLWLTDKDGNILGTTTVNVDGKAILNVISQRTNATTDTKNGYGIVYDNKVKVISTIKNTGGRYKGDLFYWQYKQGDQWMYGHSAGCDIPKGATVEVAHEFEANVGDIMGAQLESASGEKLSNTRMISAYLAGPITKDGVTFVSDGDNAIVKDVEGDGALDLSSEGFFVTPKGTQLVFEGVDKNLIEEKFEGTNRMIHVRTFDEFTKVRSLYENTTYIYSDGDYYSGSPIVLKENQPYKSSYEIYNSGMKYDHKVSDQWESICLPFTIGANQIKDYYEVKEVNLSIGSDNNITLTDAVSIEKGKPYLIKHKEGASYNDLKRTGSDYYVIPKELDTPDDNMSFIGVFTKTQKFDAASIDRDKYTYYGLATIGGEAMFVKAGEAASVTPFHAYLRVKNTADSAPQMIKIIDNNSGTNGIVNASVASELDDAPVYNLSGQRVTTFTPGIYVKNGKKFVVK